MRLKRVLLLFILLLVALTIAEFAARGAKRAWRYNAAAAPSDALIAEQHRIDFDFSRPGYVLPKDFAGAYFNIAGQRRVTPGQPVTPRRTLHLIGDSVGFGWTVDDASTIAAYLQRLMPDTLIINDSVGGATVERAYNLLRDTDLHDGDIVIILLGGQEPYSYFADYSVGTGLCASVGRMYAGLCMVNWRTIADPLLDYDTQQQWLSSYHARMLKALRQAHDYAIARGAHFAWALEPMLWSTWLTDSEKAMQQDQGIEYADLLVRQVQQQVTLELAASGIEAYDLTHALDDARNTGSDVYADFTHLTAQGNEIVARALYALATW